jgi:hypothetical protein
MTFDINAARQAGYSDQEIQQFLNRPKEKKFDYEGAKKAGYSTREIQNFERKQMYEKHKGEPGSKALGALRGLGNLAQRLSGGLETPEQFYERRDGLQGESPEQRERRKLFEGITEGTGELLLPLPGGPAEKVLQEIGGSKAAKFISQAFSKNPELKGAKAPNIKPKDAVQGIFEERAALGEPEQGFLGRKSKPLQKPEPPTDFYQKVEEAQEKLRAPLGDRTQNIGESISKQPFKSSLQAGQEIKSEAQKIKTAAREKFDKEFQNIKTQTQHLESFPTKLSHELSDFIKENRGKPLEKLSTGASKLMSAADELLKLTAEATPNGSIIGYKRPRISDLVAAKQRIGDIADWEIGESSFKGAYKEIYKQLEEEISKTIGDKSKPLLQKYKDLNKRYSEFKDTFGNQRTIELFEPKNKDFTSIFKGLQDNDSFRALEKILDKSQRGRDLLSKMKRNIFEGRSAKELSPIETQDLKDILGKNKSGLVDKAQAFQKKLPSVFEKSPEELLRQMDTRSGIRKIKEELKGIQGGDEFFSILKEAKVEEILANGKIKSSSTVQEMYDVLSNSKNFNILGELEGRGNVATELHKLGLELAKSENKALGKKLLKEVGYSALKSLPGGTLFYKIGKHLFKHA